MTDAGGYLHRSKSSPVTKWWTTRGEYVRGDAHSNTVESYFAIFKRGITGTYHNVSEPHLKRYLANSISATMSAKKLGVSDAARMAKWVQGIVGKRLTYR